MQKQIKHVEKFHDIFGIPNEHGPTVNVSKEIVALRHRLMAEENEEYFEAALNDDLVEVADALGDMMYILCGTILSLSLIHI